MAMAKTTRGKTRRGAEDDEMSQGGDQQSSIPSKSIDIAEDSDYEKESSKATDRSDKKKDKKDKKDKDRKKDKDKDKKDKKDKKHKDKKSKKDKRSRTASVSKKSKSVKRGASSDESAESDNWSAGDEGVDYGKATPLSDDSGLWKDNLS